MEFVGSILTTCNIRREGANVNLNVNNKYIYHSLTHRLPVETATTCLPMPMILFIGF